MIVTVTLNPAVDKTLFASRVVQGAVNRMDEVKNIAGGKGINVAKVLHGYDFDVICMGFIGGANGRFIKDEVSKLGIKNEFTIVGGQTRTSINVIADDGYVTELLEPGPVISDDELETFKEQYVKAIDIAEAVVISGSIPRGLSENIYAELIETANSMGKKVVLDTSGEALKKGMYARPFMMKPNIKELEQLTGKRMNDLAKIVDAATELVEWGVLNVLVSMGSKGIVYAYDSSVYDDNKDTSAIKVLYARPPHLKAKNTVGCGDSAVAAFVRANIIGLSPCETLKWCIAISAANALTTDNGIIDMEKALEFYDEVEINEYCV